MSRIGKQPIIIPEKIEVKVDDGFVIIKGPRGEVKQKIHPDVRVVIKDAEIKIDVADRNDKKQRALWGLFQRLIFNMVTGVVSGYEKKLELVGIGYKAEVKGKILVLNAGFSHSVEFKIPEGIEIKVEKNIITISGIEKQLVGETAARIRRIRKPEPYKGKGIKYVDEIIRRKAGKKAATAAA